MAHINLNHQREIRYRCKNCPLTFLKKKAFIYHHREKHKEAVEPWCTLCLEVFDGNKQREDHLCSKIGNKQKTKVKNRYKVSYAQRKYFHFFFSISLICHN